MGGRGVTWRGQRWLAIVGDVEQGTKVDAGGRSEGREYRKAEQSARMGRPHSDSNRCFRIVAARTSPDACVLPQSPPRLSASARAHRPPRRAPRRARNARRTFREIAAESSGRED